MLPDPYHSPSDRVQLAVGVTIAKDVGFELPLPPVSVRLRHGSMLRASVPEASIDEYRKLLARKKDVRATPCADGKREVDAKPQPASVELPA
jgi:hypothetical protein